MRQAVKSGLRLGAAAGAAACVLALASPSGHAASFNCKARSLTLTELAICRDPQLSRADEDTVRRMDGLGRRLNFGQYLGLRHWHSGQQRERDRCGADISCLAGSYRTQMRFLDRLQICIESNQRRRACLRNTINPEPASREDRAATRSPATR